MSSKVERYAMKQNMIQVGKKYLLPALAAAGAVGALYHSSGSSTAPPMTFIDPVRAIRGGSLMQTSQHSYANSARLYNLHQMPTMRVA